MFNMADKKLYSADYAFSPTDGQIVDLSRLAEKLTSYEDISDDLTEDEERRIVDYVKSCVDMSYHKIKKRYDHWMEADRAHDVYVPPDATQFREKAVIADTRAVADTVLTYLMAALGGRNPMFQLEGLNRSSRKVSSILERVLHSQMRRTAGEARIAQMLLDSIRYGFAPTKIVWDAGQNQNRIVNFDPRRCFPDPRVSWGDWEQWQYVVFTDYVSYNTLASSKLYPKLEKHPSLRHRIAPPRNSWDAHRWHKEEGRGLNIDPASPNQRERMDHAYFTLGDARVTDECWVRFAGHEIGIPTIDQVWMVITILDENVCIRMQLNPYGRQFPVVMGGLYNDNHKTWGQSLYDLMLPMHDIATWLLRSRIDNVQAALNNLIFVDPTQVMVPDLIDRNPWGVVRTMPGSKPGDGVFIAQVPDVTRGHWNDITAMSDLKQRVSSASDAQQGMPTPDVRTATEIQRLTQLGSQRLGVLSRVISATTIRPMVRMMVSNIQDAVEIDGSIKIDPDKMPSQLADMVEDGYIDFNQNDLQGKVDYLVIDGTLPVEPTRNAETWMNMLQIMSQTGLNMEYKMGKIAEEAIRALGISDLDQFRISEEERQQGATPSQQLAMMEKMRGASVQPNEQIQDEVSKGNLVPIREAG
nr:hypothetical protein [uncultured Mediterranean phage uvMED]